jgi:Cu/Ag efflux protein CusF
MNRMEIRMKGLLVLAAVLLAAAPAFASSGHSHHDHGAATTKSSAANQFAEGEIRKVDKAAGKVTIRHGAIASIDMPPMTMVFQVKDKAMLDKVKQGDAIRFKAEKAGDTFTVTELRPAK